MPGDITTDYSELTDRLHALTLNVCILQSSLAYQIMSVSFMSKLYHTYSCAACSLGDLDRQLASSENQSQLAQV
jgi:hypothetical protein